MADERVRILLEAKDNASATINKVSGSLGNMQPQVGGLTGTFGKLLPVMGAVGGAFAMMGGASAALIWQKRALRQKRWVHHLR